MASEGLSNPEIAQALFVTRKTVETHLGHVYTKLDIGSRGELALALVERASAVARASVPSPARLHSPRRHVTL